MYLGIDLGSSNTVSGMIGMDNQVRLVNDCIFKEDSYTPSVINIDKGRALVGKSALVYEEILPSNIFRYYKRHFGNEDILYQNEQGVNWYSESIAALMVKKIKQDIEFQFAIKVDSAVFTVPAHYNDGQRKSILLAAELGGITAKNIVEEPIAAAVHYSVNHPQSGELNLVFDLGGGTFDMTLITLNRDNVHVIAKDGISDLGGKEIDVIIKNEIESQYFKLYQKSIPNDNFNTGKLVRLSEKIKIDLVKSTNGNVKQWININNDFFEFRWNSHQFEKYLDPIWNAINLSLTRSFNSLGITWNDIGNVIMVGGSSQVPFFCNKLQKVIDKNKIIYHEPFSSVAKGAALISKYYSEKGASFLIKGVSTYNVGIRINGQIIKVINKNTPLPVYQGKEVDLIADSQGNAEFDFVQYWDEINNPFVIAKMKVMLKAPVGRTVRVNLAISISEDSTMSMKIKDQTGRELSLSVIKKSTGLVYNHEEQLKLIKETIVNI